jgi:hypothetical protein
MTEPFDLNAAIADAYIKWQNTYLAYMPKPEHETTEMYTSRMCCIAYAEGARCVQAMMQKAFLEVAAEVEK